MVRCDSVYFHVIPWLICFLVRIVEDYKKGAVLAAFPHDAEKFDGLTPEEVTALRNEKTNKWKQPWQVYYIAIISSMAAVVQGMEYVVAISYYGPTQLKHYP
jgi:hypothetical protein